jgi:lactate dehydrogenase-like 2-hydroxyacid dehydrogenase
MDFRKIVGVDNTGLEPWAKKEIAQFSEEVVFYEEDPIDVAELISRAKEADALLVSWRTLITKEVIEACPHLKYIGMCCSLYDENSANVDIAFAREKGIGVLGVRDYGDEGLVEFIFSELIRLFHGFGEHQYAEKQEELTGKKLGIIGMGATGQMLMNRALAFGMNVYYYNRSRKPELENDKVEYMALKDLLKASDIISTHLPKHSKVIDQEGFKNLGEGKVLINTSLEPTFDVEAFKVWIQGKRNFAIMDRVGLGQCFDELTVFDHVIYTEKTTGFTKQAEGRLSQKVIDNIKKHIKNNI